MFKTHIEDYFSEDPKIKVAFDMMMQFGPSCSVGAKPFVSIKRRHGASSETDEVWYGDHWPASTRRGIDPRFQIVVEDGGHASGWEKEDTLAEETWTYGLQSWLLHHFFCMDVEESPTPKKGFATPCIRPLRKHLYPSEPKIDPKDITAALQTVGAYLASDRLFNRLGFCYQKCKQGQEISALAIQCGALGSIARNAIEACILDSIHRLGKNPYFVFQPYDGLPETVKKVVDPKQLFNPALLGDKEELDPQFKDLLIRFTQALIEMSQGSPDDLEYVKSLKDSCHAYLGEPVLDPVAHLKK